MLNTTSAYFRDQLLEKLQLMLATRELYILKHSRNTDSTYNQSVTFQVSATQEEWKVEYDADPKSINLPLALSQLAEDMTNTMHNYLRARLVDIAPEETFTRDPKDLNL